MDNPFRLGLERAVLDYEIFRSPDTSGRQRQRATEIDAAVSNYPSRMFELGKRIGIYYFAYVNEEYGQQRRAQHRTKQRV